MSPRHRWWRRIAVAAVLAVPSGLAAAALLEPEDGPGHDLVGAIEQEIRQNDGLHYEIHRTLGKVLSFCPCTERQSRAQYAKAAFHRPRPTPTPTR